MEHDDEQDRRAQARRKFLKAAVYLPPLVVSAVSASKAHAQASCTPGPDCGPITCMPGVCMPGGG